MIGTVFLNVAEITQHSSTLLFASSYLYYVILFPIFIFIPRNKFAIASAISRLILFSSSFFAHLIGAEGLVKLAAGKYVLNCLTFKLPVILYVLCCTSLISTLI